jgi:hypothetical protein
MSRFVLLVLVTVAIGGAWLWLALQLPSKEAWEAISGGLP